MPQLLVRDVSRDLVKALKRRAAEHGRSAEVEHRIILKEALRAGTGRISRTRCRFARRNEGPHLDPIGEAYTARSGWG